VRFDRGHLWSWLDGSFGALRCSNTTRRLTLSHVDGVEDLIQFQNLLICG